MKRVEDPIEQGKERKRRKKGEKGRGNRDVSGGVRRREKWRRMRKAQKVEKSGESFRIF